MLALPNKSGALAEKVKQRYAFRKGQFARQYLHYLHFKKHEILKLPISNRNLQSFKWEWVNGAWCYDVELSVECCERKSISVSYSILKYKLIIFNEYLIWICIQSLLHNSQYINLL